MIDPRRLLRHPLRVAVTLVVAASLLGVSVPHTGALVAEEPEASSPIDLTTPPGGRDWMAPTVGLGGVISSPGVSSAMNPVTRSSLRVVTDVSQQAQSRLQAARQRDERARRQLEVASRNLTDAQARFGKANEEFRVRAVYLYMNSGSKDSGPLDDTQIAGLTGGIEEANKVITKDTNLDTLFKQGARNFQDAKQALEKAIKDRDGAAAAIVISERTLKVATDQARVSDDWVKRLQSWTPLAGSQVGLDVDGCVSSAPQGTFPEEVDLVKLCHDSMDQARDPEGATAIRYAMAQLGSTYDQSRRMAFDIFDCSSLVSRAWEAAGARVVSVGNRGWAPTTWNILAAPWARSISISAARPGDLLFPSDGHVAMMLADGWMIHTTDEDHPARIERAYTRGVARAIVPDALSDLPIPEPLISGTFVDPVTGEIVTVGPSLEGNPPAAP